jgi:SAM-dependent methyltransferase
MTKSGKMLKDKYGFENPFKADPLARKSLRYLKCTGRLLDVGCGEGADSVFFANKGFEVTAIDNNESYLGRLRNFVTDHGYAGIAVKYGDVISYPYRKNYFDVINCLLVGCCMKRSEFEKLVVRLKQAIKRSGIIVMSLRNYLDEEFSDYVASEKMIEPNTFRKKEDCCKIRYFIEKNRLRESFSEFEVMYYYEGYAPDKYQEVEQHGDSYIICRR